MSDFEKVCQRSGCLQYFHWLRNLSGFPIGIKIPAVLFPTTLMPTSSASAILMSSAAGTTLRSMIADFREFPAHLGPGLHFQKTT